MWIHCVHVSQSSGILSPSGAKISEDLQMNQVEYGCISPVYSIGRWVGAVLFSFVFNSINRKYIMVFAGVTHGLINMFYMFTSNGYVILSQSLRRYRPYLASNLHWTLDWTIINSKICKILEKLFLNMLSFRKSFRIFH